MQMDLAPAALSRVPPPMQHFVLRRGEWSLCAMEHSRIESISIDDPGAPFHHLSLPLGGDPPKLEARVDGVRQRASFDRDTISIIQAHAGGTTCWDGPFESACFYFTPLALNTALGLDLGEGAYDIRSTLNRHAPVTVHLLRALLADVVAGQPHGTLVGDAIFAALAAQFVPGRRIGTGPSGRDWRVRRALEYIHTHLSERLTIPSIADAAATSPFHLARAFRVALGCSIWQYVLRERARRVAVLIKDPGLNLAQVAQLAGFETYASFVAAVRREFGALPGTLHRAHAHRQETAEFATFTPRRPRER